MPHISINPQVLLWTESCRNVLQCSKRNCSCGGRKKANLYKKHGTCNCNRRVVKWPDERSQYPNRGQLNIFTSFMQMETGCLQGLSWPLCFLGLMYGEQSLCQSWRLLHELPGWFLQGLPRIHLLYSSFGGKGGASLWQCLDINCHISHSLPEIQNFKSQK